MKKARFLVLTYNLLNNQIKSTAPPKAMAKLSTENPVMDPTPKKDAIHPPRNEPNKPTIILRMRPLLLVCINILATHPTKAPKIIHPIIPI